MTDTLSGSRIIDAIAAAGVQYAIAVPDIVTARGILGPMAADPRFHMVRVTKEDECIGISSALSICGKRSISLFQNTGFLDSINAIAHLGVQYSLPNVMLIGLLDHKPGTDPKDSHRLAVHIVPPMLDAMGIDYIVLDIDEDTTQLRSRIDIAFTRSKPLAILIGRRPAP